MGCSTAEGAAAMRSAASIAISRRSFLAGGILLGGIVACSPLRALADEGDRLAGEASEKMEEADALRQRLIDMQDLVAQRTEDYYRALDERDEAARAVADAQERIDQATARIAEVQGELAARARSMYRSGQITFVDVVMGSASFEEFAKNWYLLDALNENDARMVREAKDLRAEVEAAKVELEDQERIASDKAAEAQRIKAETESTVAEMEAELEALDAEALALLEEEQAARRAAAIAAAEAARKKTYGYTDNGRDIPSQGSVVDYALSRIGCPYVWGAEGPAEFDCSGLVRWAYLQVGIELPHQTEALYHAAKARLPVSEAQPGDVLWIGYGDGYNGHVGIACNEGGTRYVHAPTYGAFVRDTDPLGWAGFTHALRF